MKSKFEILYEKVIDSAKYGIESVFIHGMDFKLHKKKYSNLNDFFKDCIFIKDSDNIPSIFDGINILNEDSHPEVRYGNSILQKIKNKCSNDLQYFSVKWVKESISNKWKYYKKLSKINDNIKVFYICDDFEHPRNMLRKIFTSLCGESFNDLIHNEDFNNVCDNFIRDSETFQGFFYQINDVNLLCFNQKTFTVKTVSHEFTHFMQKLLKINFLKEKIEYSDDEKIEIKKELQLTEKDLNYIFSETEFWTIIYNDLYYNLQFLYRIQLKEWTSPYKTFNSFIDFLKFIIEEDPHRIMVSKIGLTWNSYEKLAKDSIQLRLLAALKILGKDKLFEKVFKKLKQH